MSARSTPGCCAGDPLTLVDTGPRDDGALAALEDGLRREGLRLEDIELVLAHPPPPRPRRPRRDDRSAARAPPSPRSTASPTTPSATPRETERDRPFSHRLMAHHGVPDQVVADDEGFWDFIRGAREAVRARTVRLADGEHIRAGGRDLRVVARPGHSTTDTLFVDDRDALAFGGDHLLVEDLLEHRDLRARPRRTTARPRSRVRYLDSLRRTAEMPLDAPADGPRRPGHRPRRAWSRRGFSTTSGAASASWRSSRTARAPRTRSPAASGRPRTVAEQPLLVVWEVARPPRAAARRAATSPSAPATRSVFELTDAGRASARARDDSAGARRAGVRLRRASIRGDRPARVRRHQPASQRTTRWRPVRPLRPRGAGHRRHARARARHRARVLVGGRRHRGGEPQGGRVRRGRRGAASRRRPRVRAAPAMSGAGTTSSGWSRPPIASFGRVDVLVNNAGVSPLYPTLWPRAARSSSTRSSGSTSRARSGCRRSSASAWPRATAARSSTSRAPAPCARPATSSPTRRPRPASTR